MQQAKQMIAEVLNEAADIIATGKAAVKARIGLTLLGSEHGPGEVLAGAEAAQRRLPDAKVTVIGPADIATDLAKIAVADEEEGHRVVDRLLASGDLDAVVTMHYNFPIGTSTVGLAVTPARGAAMFIACTTGTSSTDRVEGMVRNAVYGIAAAKAYGIANPTVGILNVDGARQVERALKDMKERGYNIAFAASHRADGGIVMRGNDVLAGTPQVLVCDSLTGNILVKMLAAYSSGGSYEALGYGYGPGIGENFGNLIHIISRASGAPVIAGAIEYAAAMVKGKLTEVAREEMSSAAKAGLADMGKSPKTVATNLADAPAKKVVSQQIAGIDVLDIENAQQLLWRNNIYAETGMGCTGPVILVADEDQEKAKTVLKDGKIINGE